MPLIEFDPMETRRLLVAATTVMQRAKAMAKRAREDGLLARARATAVQLVLFGTLSERTPKTAVVRGIMDRRRREAILPKGPASVFQLADYSVKRVRLDSKPKTVPRRVTAEDGRQVYETMHHTETVEWKEKERVRRAKQKPPRPTNQTGLRIKKGG